MKGEVTVKDGKLSDIKITEEYDSLTGQWFEVAEELLIPRILEAQSTGVDAITGATVFGLDADGKFVFKYFDTAQNSAQLNSEGHWTLPEKTTTKRELGNEYGMLKASSIGKEWFEQLDAFQAYCVGKTLDEVIGMELADGLSTDVDLLAGCTVRLTPFISGLEVAKLYQKAL